MSASPGFGRPDRPASFVRVGDPSSPATRRGAPPALWLMLGGCTVASLDMLSAMAYWAPHGVAPQRILQSIAVWLVGPAAFDGGLATALLGGLIYALLMWGVVALYGWLARKQALLLRRPLLCGGIYGALAYLAIFQVMAPLLTGFRGTYDLPWIATCVVVYVTLVGMPCAWFAKAAAHARD